MQISNGLMISDDPVVKNKHSCCEVNTSSTCVTLLFFTTAQHVAAQDTSCPLQTW